MAKDSSKGRCDSGAFRGDFLVGFQHLTEARRFVKELEERLKPFGLNFHPEKTRLIEFGRYAEERLREHNEDKPETFTFLGFTHSCSKNSKGYTYDSTPHSR